MGAASSMYNNILLKYCLLLSITIFCCSLQASNSNSEETIITPIKHGAWLKHLALYKPNIVVVDMWAMWCSSCLERFPEMVSLHNKYKDHGVKFISMNLDDRNDKESLLAAENFISAMNATFDHFHMDENLLDAFKKINLISIPAVLIYNQEGVEKYRLSGDNPNNQFTEHDIELAIKNLLKN